jgi:hypothetical protein
MLKIAAQSREMDVLMIFMDLVRYTLLSEKYLLCFAAPERMAFFGLIPMDNV